MRLLILLVLFIGSANSAEAQFFSRIKNWFRPNNSIIEKNESLILPAAIADFDKDGVPDKDDSCKTIPGVSILNGCPDADGDGIADHLDACPKKAGSYKLNGCPDRDNDGIPDDQDECPDKFGLAHLNGCLDTDNDGISDQIDECPNNPGAIANKGCPELPIHLKNSIRKVEDLIDFEKSTHIISKKSVVYLNELVQEIQKHQEYKFEIYCFANETGNPEKDNILSTQRAASIEEFLISKGVFSKRLSFKSFSKTDMAIPTLKLGKTKTYIKAKLIYP